MCNLHCAICNLQSALCNRASIIYTKNAVWRYCTLYYLPFNTVPKSLPIEKHTLTILYSVTYNILYRPLYRLYWANLGLNRPLLAYIPRPIHNTHWHGILSSRFEYVCYSVQSPNLIFLYADLDICRQCLFNILYIVQCTCIRLVQPTRGSKRQLGYSWS